MICECQNHLHINSRTNLIYQRFYLVKRLQHSIDLLHNYEMQHDIMEQLDPSFFCHIELQQAITEMKNNKSFVPLHNLWQKFNAYQYLYDPVFEDECIKLICLLCMLKESIYEIRFYSSREQRLLFLDAITDALDYGSNSNRTYMKNQMLLEVTIDHVAKRYFVIKRLHKAMQFLTLVHEYDKRPFERRITRTGSVDYIEDIQDEIEQFSHVRIKECLTDLCQKKNLEPILQVYTECKRYRYVADDDFLKETFRSIFLVYKSMLLKNLAEQTEQVVLSEVQEILEVYENLDRFSLDDALEAIDIATDRLIAIQNMQVTDQQNKLTWLLPGAILSGFLVMTTLNHFNIV